MDIYLPADFRSLHDEVVTDWRDVSSTVKPADAIVTRVAHTDECDVDPDWLVI